MADINREQLKNIIIKGKERGFTTDQIVNRLESQGHFIEGFSQPKAPKQDGFIKGVAKDIARPFVKLGVSTAALGGGITNLAKAGGAALAGDKEEAQQFVNKAGQSLQPKHIPGLDEDIRPVSIDRPKEIASTALELGSTVVGGGGAAKVAQAGLRNALRQSIKVGVREGATAGGMFGAGQELRQEDATIGSVAESLITGTATGAVGGGAFGTVAPFTGRVFNRFFKKDGTGKIVEKAVGEGVEEVAEDTAGRGIVGRTADRLKLKGESIAENIQTKQARSQRIGQASSKAEGDLLRLDFDDAIVDSFKNANVKDVAVAKNIFNQMRIRSKNPLSKVNPKENVGKTILRRAEFLIKQKNKDRIALKQVVSKLPKKRQDVSDIYNQFTDDLQNLGLGVSDEGKILRQPNSKIPSRDVTGYQTLLDEFGKLDKNGQILKTPSQMHTMRQFLFDEFNFVSEQQNPFSANIVPFVGKYRTALKQRIGTLSNEYEVLTEQLAKNLEVLREVAKLSTFKGRNVDDILAKDLRLGEVGLRTLGNAADRPYTMLKNLEDVAIEFGFKADDNMFDQLMMFDMLERLFGTQQTRSFRGQAAAAGADVLKETAGAARDVATGNLWMTALQKMKPFIGTSDEKMIKVFGEFLDGLIK